MRSRAIIVVAAALVLVAYAVWAYRVQLGELVLTGALLKAYMHKTLGVKRRPKSSWAALGKTAALLYAAWNSRWLKGLDAKVTVPKRAVTAPDDHVPTKPDRVPAYNGPIPF